ncbi:MAG: dephospho-CoA kinase [Thermomicrobiales bacterium]
MRPYLIGVTGNIACGKSAVMSMLRDLVQRSSMAISSIAIGQSYSSPLVQQLSDVFGNEIANDDGSLNRALGDIVFSDPEALYRLDHLTPGRCRRGPATHRSGPTPVVATEGVKLIESGLGDQCDEIWVVMCDPARQRERLVATRGLSQEEANRRIASQPPLGEKLARADIVIANDGTLDELRAQVGAAWMRSGASRVVG